MARKNPSKPAFKTQGLVIDGRDVAGGGMLGSSALGKTILIVVWLVVIGRSALALI